MENGKRAFLEDVLRKIQGSAQARRQIFTSKLKVLISQDMLSFEDVKNYANLEMVDFDLLCAKPERESSRSTGYVGNDRCPEEPTSHNSRCPEEPIRQAPRRSEHNDRCPDEPDRSHGGNSRCPEEPI